MSRGGRGLGRRDMRGDTWKREMVGSRHNPSFLCLPHRVVLVNVELEEYLAKEGALHL
jgi:hypothetical protein